jgi:hypothetical protein
MHAKACLTYAEHKYHETVSDRLGLKLFVDKNISARKTVLEECSKKKTVRKFAAMSDVRKTFSGKV